MITCVCMNPAMDKTIELDEFAYGGMNRVRRAMYDPSGKAVNVAIVLARLGDKAALTGINYRDGGAAVQKRLSDEGVDSEFVWLDGALRVNIKILDRKTGKITEINESGAPVNAADAQRAAELIDAGAAKSDYVAMTGSLPPGIAADFYRRALERNEGRTRFVLDCEGEKLTEGIKAKPFLIKPNKYELGLLNGRELNNRTEIVNFARQICVQGVEWVAVSLGSEGAVMVGRKAAYFSPVLDVPVRSTVGAGDSMVAGLIHGFAVDGRADTALRWGVACANASVMTEGTQLIDTSAVPELFGRVEIENV